MSPLGWAVGFLRVPFEEARRATLQWRESLALRYRYRFQVRDCGALEGERALLDVFALLDPLQTPPKKELLIGTDGEWTMNVVNNHLGGDSESWVGHLAGELGCDGVLATHIPEGQYPYPLTRFCMLGPKGPPPLHYVRRIDAAKNDSERWEFRSSGEPQPFEEVERYTARRIRDRFNREMLVRYLTALGIEPDRNSFFTQALLLETEPASSRESSVADTQRKYGFAP